MQENQADAGRTRGSRQDQVHDFHFFVLRLVQDYLPPYCRSRAKNSCQYQCVVLNIFHDGTRASVSATQFFFIVSRELHLMKGPESEAIVSVVCSSNILRQHNIINRFSRLVWFSQIATNSTDMPEYRLLSQRLDRCDRVIQNEYRYPFGGNVYYVAMKITYLTRKLRNGERNLHCDVVHVTTKWVSSLTLDCNGVFAIKAYRITASARDVTSAMMLTADFARCSVQHGQSPAMWGAFRFAALTRCFCRQSHLICV